MPALENAATQAQHRIHSGDDKAASAFAAGYYRVYQFWVDHDGD